MTVRKENVLMGVNKKDRSDYEKGQRDRKKGFIDQVITDLSGQHPGTSAYYKGRRNEQLDKGSKKKK